MPQNPSLIPENFQNGRLQEFQEEPGNGCSMNQPHPFELILKNLLEPITADSFEQVIDHVKQHLILLNQMLSLLEKTEFEGLLFKILQAVTLKVGELLRADRTTIFLRDESQQELWSIVAQDDQANPIEIRIPDDEGIAGYVVQQGITVNIPVDFYDDPRSDAARILDQNTGYRTYSLLTLPLVNGSGTIVAVVQLLNKCRPEIVDHEPLSARIDPDGFTQNDEVLLDAFSDAIVLLLDSYQAFDRALQKQRASDALMRATQYLFEANLNWEETVEKVLQEAQKLLCTQYIDIWLMSLNDQKLYQPFHSLSMAGLAQQGGPNFGRLAEAVVTSEQPIRLNGLSAEQLQRFDLDADLPLDNVLGLPLWSSEHQIIGVTILANKTQRHSANSSQICTRQPVHVNFEPEDEAVMDAFNHHAGLALERARRFQDMEVQILQRTGELEQQQQKLRQEIAERTRAEAQLQQLNHQLEELASIDALTKIENRRYFDLQLSKEWKRLRREQKSLSLILCDVDFFKKYNDTYGHLEGDRCLYEVAQAIRETVKRPADVVARYGGEEFVVLLPNTPSQGALHVAHLIRESVEKLKIPHVASPQHRVVTLSVGVASMVPQAHEDQAHVLIHTADQGLYRAKHLGRNQVVFNSLE